MSGNAAVEAAVAALNDQIFIHPLSPADYLGEGITAAVQNVFGRSVRPVVRSTKLGAGNGFFGALMAGSKAACLTSGQVLPMMLPALYDIALQCHHGAVIHATADVIGEDLIRRSDYSDVLGAAASGFALLTSHSVQEAYDMAIAAQLAAARSGGSVLHVVDGGRIAQQHSQVVKLPREALVSELDKAAKDGKAPFGKALDAVFADLESHFGKRYRAIEYAGNKNPKLVYVALGSDAAVFEDAVVKSSVPAGIVKIRLYRPLDAAALLAAIPGSAEKIVVWDSVLDGNAYLYKDVAATLARQRSNLGLIRLSNASGKALTPSAIIGATKVLLRGSKTVLAADLADFAEEEVVPEGGEYLFWGTSDINIDRVTGQIAAQTAPDVSTRFLSHDALLPTVVSRAELRIGGPEVAAPAAYPVSAADITFVLADSVWAGYDVVADAKDGGIVVFNTALSDEDLDQALPLATKKAIAARRLKVLAVDATQIAKNYTIFVGKPEAYLELILRGLFSHLRSDKDGAQFMQRIREELLAVETNFTVLRTKISAVARAVRELRTVKAFTVEQDAEGQQPLKRNVDGTIRLDGPQINFGDDEDESGKFAAHKSHVAAWNIIFRESLRMDDTSMRPDVAEAQVATVTTNVRVTPESYDRNIFHMEIDISKTNLKYQMGDALAVHGLNDEKEVAEFLSDYGVRPDDVVVMRRRNAAGKEVSDTVTARQLFTMYLDVFGKPAKKFYQDLSAFAKDPDEKRTLRWLGSSDGEAEFKRRADLLYSYADVLLEFKSARVPLGDLARIIPFTKPRAYSISSSASMHPTSVHLLVVLVDWPGKDGKMRHGQCSHYLANIRPGQPIIVSLTPSVMKLPADPSTPVIMAGLGTGMAPFRAFVQEREYMRNEGANVGDMSLYFGSRHRAMEWLYGEELEVYHSDGLLTDLRLAFSRDQARKVYIQHKISEDGDRLFDLLTRQKGHFYLCGPTWPVPDIKAALIKAFVKNGYTAESAEEYLDELKERGAYVLEVY
ncbi:hypothetical protein DFJ74DRAFT_281598 [Hyaloraphidium curvatum]|nr:hypothetical protein DFJ74DRAFT_281598 [Hyaloraphidium curvatum]